MDLAKELRAMQKELRRQRRSNIFFPIDPACRLCRSGGGLTDVTADSISISGPTLNFNGGIGPQSKGRFSEQEGLIRDGEEYADCWKNLKWKPSSV